MTTTRFLFLVIVLSVLGNWGVADAQAQVLRRLRERLFNPPPAPSTQDRNRRLPARPIPVPESGPSADYRRPDGLQPVSPLPSSSPNGTPTPAQLPGGVRQAGGAGQGSDAAGERSDGGRFGRSILAPLGLDEKEASKVAPTAAVSESGTSATLGIKGQAANPGYPSVQVTELLPHSLAGRGGLKAGDHIFAIDGRPTPSVAALAAEVRARRPGEQVRLRIGRGGRVSDVLVELAARPGSGAVSSAKADTSAEASQRMPEPQPVPRAAPVASRSLEGVQISDAPGRRGVVIEAVEPGSLAAAAQLKKGDRIVAVDGRMVSDGQSLGELLGAVGEEDAAEIRLIRQNRLVDVSYSLDASKAATNGSTETTGGETGSVLGGLGSVLGGMFGKGASGEAPPSTAQPSAASNSDPVPAAKTGSTPAPEAERPKEIQIKPFGGAAPAPVGEKTPSPAGSNAPAPPKSIAPPATLPSLGDLFGLEPAMAAPKPPNPAPTQPPAKSQEEPDLGEGLTLPTPADETGTSPKADAEQAAKRKALQDQIKKLQEELEGLGDTKAE